MSRVTQHNYYYYEENMSFDNVRLTDGSDFDRTGWKEKRTYSLNLELYYRISACLLYNDKNELLKCSFFYSFNSPFFFFFFIFANCS